MQSPARHDTPFAVSFSSSKSAETFARLQQSAIVGKPQKGPEAPFSPVPAAPMIAQQPPKVFGAPGGGSMYFGKGDAGTHMFGRGFDRNLSVTPKLDGEGWTGGAQNQPFVEMNTTSQNRLRAFRSPSSPNIITYCTNPKSFPKSRYWGNE